MVNIDEIQTLIRKMKRIPQVSIAALAGFKYSYSIVTIRVRSYQLYL